MFQMNDLEVAAMFALECIEIESILIPSTKRNTAKQEAEWIVPTIYLFTIWAWKVNQKFALCNVNKKAHSQTNEF